ncbi:MAG: putative toxin-antitoxin system toxin component, PIN family [Bryobacteraceae bacterium]
MLSLFACLRAFPRTRHDLGLEALVFGGKPAAVLQLAEAGAFQLLASAEIREELLATLTGKFGWSNDRAEEACRELWDEVCWVAPPQAVRAIRDPGGDFILACALESQAAFVIGGDPDRRDLRPFRDVAIVAPAAFLARIARELGRP